ncbi:MAG: insulinase family protein [Acidobacteriaceae bacterium]|nr:insulinase family protein [Acidobacteriaceae bacterium]
MFAFRRLFLRLLASATCIVYLISGNYSIAQTASAVSDVPKIEYEKYMLPNGLQVILHVDRKLPMVHVNCWYHVGSKNERAGRTGFAHLFEHMMFEGSKDANGKYFPFIERAGANLFEGGVNGTTSEDRTNYFESVPSGSLEYVLWLESDRLATLTDVLTKTKLDNEREIVKNERRQGLENQPYGRAFSLIVENLFPAGHPYSHSVIGIPEDLNAASVEDVTNFFHTYYSPNNLSLAMTGDFDTATAKRLVEKYFGPVPPGPALDRPKHWVPVLTSQKLVEVSDHVPQERTYFVWPAPAFFDKDDAELELASSILADGLTSRLYKSLVYEKQVASDVVAFQWSSEIAGAFAIWATARPGASLHEIEGVVSQEIGRLAREGPTAAELSRAKAKWELQYLTGLERIGGFGGQADLLNQYNTFLGDPDKFAADVQRHRAVTVASLKQATATWLNNSNNVLIRFHPTSATLDANAKIDRSQTPALGADKPFEAPAVLTSKLENGMSVLVVQRNTLPKVTVQLATRAGSADDPVEKAGLASLAVAAMTRGTQTRKSFEIDDNLGDLGTAIDGSAHREYSSLSLEVLKRNIAPALAILSDVTEHPTFPSDEVDREKKKRLDSLSQQESSPGAIANRVGPVLLFGADHPYGRPTQGFRSTVQSITRDDMGKFHAAYWKPGSSVLIFTGDITLDEAVQLSKTAFGSWQGGSAPAPSIPAPHRAEAGKIYLVNRPDAAQTYVSELLPAPEKGTNEYYPFALADAVWGGAAGARLGTNIREEKGYSYGVFSFPSFLSKYSYWVASGGVQTDKTKESVVEFQKELHFIAGEKPVSDKELTTARQYRIRSYAQQFESLSRVSQEVMELWALNRPMSDLQNEPDELAKVKVESVNAVAEKYANPGHAVLLLVGDAAKVEPGLRQANLGEIVHLDVEGRPAATN